MSIRAFFYDFVVPKITETVFVVVLLNFVRFW